MNQVIRQQSSGSLHPDRHPIRDGVSTHCAQMILGANGEIKHITKDARDVLGYYPSQRIERSFFQLVHDDHRLRVMWDLAEMVGRHRQHAEWLVRIKTGIGMWTWWRVQASNQLHQSGPSGVVLTLTPANRAGVTKPLA